MGRSGKRRNRNRGQNQPRDVTQTQSQTQTRKPYLDTVRENEAFEAYYKKQCIVPDDEWDQFIKAAQEPLPAAFRVTGSRSQALHLLKLIKHSFFNKLNQANTESETQKNSIVSDETAVTDSTNHENDAHMADSAKVNETPASNTKPSNSQDDSSTNENGDGKNEVIKPPICLDWYPNNLAWQLEYSRVSIRHNETLKRLHSFLVSENESGNISRQEAVSMIPPLLMKIKSHHKILDMCAAPGSKTAQIIEYLHADSADPMPKGFVIGNDVDNKRCYLMVHQIKRLQSPNFMIINHDATRLPTMNFENKETGQVEPLLFDRILCDVPCSGDGTLRKNPEVWRTWGPGHAINLHSVQLRVLQRGLELLAVGGRLVYSTCSFNPVENEAIIAATINKCEGNVHLVDCSDDLKELKRNPGLKAWKVHTKQGDWFDSFSDVPQQKQSWVRPSMFPPDNINEINIDRCIRILPHHQNTGGFFIAVIEKTGNLPWQKKTESKSDEKSLKESEANDEKESRCPPAKKIKYAGFREEPFYYLDKTDAQWPSIKKFYGIDDKFDCTQMMVRSLESVKKRNIYLSSMSIRNVALHNENRVKYINTGVKILARSEHALSGCSHRLVQDGLSSISHYITSRKLSITKDDVIELLTQENPFFSRLTKATENALQGYEVGGLVLLYNHRDEDGSECNIEMVGWRGKASCRLYVPKFDRHHYLRLCGIDPDKALADAEWMVKEVSKGEQADGKEGVADEAQTDVKGEESANCDAVDDAKVQEIGKRLETESISTDESNSVGDASRTNNSSDSKAKSTIDIDIDST